MSRKRPRTESTDENGENNKSLQATTSLITDQDSDLPLQFEPSIFAFKPSNDFVRFVSDFLYEHVNKDNIEIEAKLGVLLSKDTKTRIDMPVTCETIIHRSEEHRCQFESNMTPQQHCHFNNILNARVNHTMNPSYQGAPVKYKHTKETDRFYRTESGNKIRVTTDQSSGQILEGGVVEKIRIANLNIYSPNTHLDYRITVNIEKPRLNLSWVGLLFCVKGPMPKSQPDFERNKDRMTYLHQIFKFDLTQVKIPERPSQNGVRAPSQEVTHELEVEFVDPTILLRERQKIEKGLPNRFMEVVEVFLDNIRILAKKDMDCPQEIKK
ncbi:12576_t:CDS:2 [Ambispora gerdemannii]|uniref:mRNA-capping enzyme subunit beta n=1 Tax=Ambispora gerdemannii TaxID=144530 RepID=A0A9N8WFP0_9GLOM|nr:12576_t:CDS:2 [Ambispora gerdemannii]